MLADCCPECGVSGLTGSCLMRYAGCRCNAAAAPIPSAATVAQLLRAAHPVTQVPLMRSPDGTQLLCTNCGRNTTTAGAAAADAAEAAESGPTEAPAAAPQANGTGGHADSSSDEEADQGLLQPPPPLRSRLQAAATLDGAAPPQQAARPAASALQQLPVPAPGPAAGTARAAAPARDERPGSSSGGQEASKAIAELMLEGWAMLQEHCPRCGPRREAQADSCVAGRDASSVCGGCADKGCATSGLPVLLTSGGPRLHCCRRCLNPLLRSRDRQRIYCAGCRLDVVREGEQPGAAAIAPPAAAPAAAPAGGYTSSRAAAQPPAAAAASSTVVSGASAVALQQHGAAVDAAAAAVAARLSAATAALPAAAADRAAQLLGEVRLCAAALQALADARAALGTHSATL